MKTGKNDPRCGIPCDTLVCGKNRLANGHQLFQHKLFGPHPKRPILGPQKKVYVPHFLGKNAREAHKHKLFRGILGVKNGVPDGPFWATTSLVYCFFLPLKKEHKD